MRLFLSDPFIQECILEPLNLNLERKRFSITSDQQERCRRVDISVFWRFLGHYITDMMIRKGLFSHELAKIEGLRNSFIGKRRFETIHSCFDFMEEQLAKVIDHLRKTVSQLKF